MKTLDNHPSRLANAPEVALLVGHADAQAFNHRLAAAYEKGLVQAGVSVTRFNLADLAFDPILRTGFREPQPLEHDLQRVRDAIDRSVHLAWVFPTYWAAPPALVRGLFDRLFLPGWAFQYEAGKAFPRKLLMGKSSRVVATMDSPNYWYTLHYRRCLHRSFGTGSLEFCGLSPVEFTTVYQMRSLGEEARERILVKLEAVGVADGRRAAAKASLSKPHRNVEGAIPAKSGQGIELLRRT